ncbi:HepT-like ribonuclease domain-containing protein [Deinococcus sp.]
MNRLNRFRNRIIHEYSHVAPAVVWLMVTEALPRLEQEA